MKEYKNSFDRTAKVATFFTTFGLAGMLFLTFYFQNLSSLAFVLIFTGLAISLLIPALFFPKTYFLDQNQLTVVTPVKKISILVKDIQSVELDQASIAKNSIRIMGSGGFFGYFGWFKNSALGRFKMYCTRLDKHVIIKTDKNTFVLSPDENVEFVKDLNSKIKL